ncbi:putative GTP-binding protein EngB [Nymphon striatum]|nr:putative GTP-binding protein EngB [Nymphon striatum]
MRHAPFFGWIQDLAAPDPTSIFNLFGLIPFEVGGIFLVGIWPVIMGITMFLQFQMNPAPPDPTQAMIFKWMPLVFTFMLATFPAGLVIYWAWNNTLSLIQAGHHHEASLALNEAALEKGRLLFAKGWEFLLGVPSMKFMPPEGPLEISFAGRSNVGKSSLINALVNQKGLARTSNTPGRTQELNYFIPKDSGEVPDYAIVDMPGYGYAKAPKNQVEAWTRLVFSYLRGRTTLRRVFVLIDSRHGIKKNDEEVFKMMDKAACSYQIVLTKSDKIKVHRP